VTTDEIHAGRWRPDRDAWAEECARAADRLSQRLGPDGVAWLDDFLADYVFMGEPLDRILATAREMCRLPSRELAASDDD
jgi:hypothetical protein